jgi:hypothetical protein
MRNNTSFPALPQKTASPLLHSSTKKVAETVWLSKGASTLETEKTSSVENIINKPLLQAGQFWDEFYQHKTALDFSGDHFSNQTEDGNTGKSQHTSGRKKWTRLAL